MSTIHSEAAERWLKDFQSDFSKSAPESSWLQTSRRQAIAAFSTRGLPTTRMESWKYTSLSPMLATGFRLAPQVEDSAALPYIEKSLPANRMVFINGRYAPGLSNLRDTESLILIPLTEAISRYPQELEQCMVNPHLDNGFSALNEAFWQDGAYLRLAPHAKPDSPVYLTFVTLADQPCVTHPRVMLFIGENAALTLVENYVGKGPYLTNTQSAIHLEKEARLDYLRLQCESPAAHHIGEVSVIAEAGSSFQSHSIALGGVLARVSLSTRLNGNGASCKLHGLMIGHGHQHQDEHTHIQHAKPDTSSEEHYRSILDDASRSVFCGRVTVEEGASQSKAQQASHNLLLSREAEADTLPQLEIFNDDVRCSHGATVGQLDETALFYLKSRGIGQGEAITMLTRAFAQVILDSIINPFLQEKLGALIGDKLDKPQDGGAKHVFFHG
ncbi:MAG: Fe-S cluster assembly protein SufD [Pseudomonadota bacterium]|nr:Fe-S cluster assembly protein SufD [Pseudomonadota bacterium]